MVAIRHSERVPNTRSSRSGSSSDGVLRVVTVLMLLVGLFNITTHLPQQLSVSKRMSGAISSTISKQVERRDKKGRLVHHAITSVSKKDLGNIGDDDAVGNNPDRPRTLEEAQKGREEIIAILKNAGVEEIDLETMLRLPTWEQVTDLYGDGPVVYGLDTCKRFRETIPVDDASIGPAGLFNTGTNPFAMYLSSNCIMPHNKRDCCGGMRWQVPWGKHMPASRKWTNTAKNDHRVNKTNVLPVAIVRDPLTWMHSMCKHPYEMKWHRDNELHCPNLVPNEVDKEIFPFLGNSVPVRVKFDSSARSSNATKWNSMAHLWSDWYNQYRHADYPRLIIRFEDLFFHVQELVQTICECGGGVPKEEGKFTYIVDTAKWGPGHKREQTNLISGMIKYGTGKKRYDSMTQEDLALAYEALDPELMEIFHYKVPPPGS